MHFLIFIQIVCSWKKNLVVKGLESLSEIEKKKEIFL